MVLVVGLIGATLFADYAALSSQTTVVDKVTFVKRVYTA
jgi:hypothetical protein